VTQRLHAILGLKCPICFRGSTFRSRIYMNESCPVCGLKFEREQGYFLSALYVAYGLAVPILSLLTLGVWLLTRRTVGQSFLIAIIVFVPLSYWVFRYSRVIWMHLDQILDPRPETQGN
jgi:uncharacterized protein (DUF983 family)